MLHGLLKLKYMTVPNFPFSTKVYNSNKNAIKACLLKFYFVKWWQSYSALEVHKLSCWHLFPYLTGNISLEFADTNFTLIFKFLFLFILCEHWFWKIKDIFCRFCTHIDIYELKLSKVLVIHFVTQNLMNILNYAE